ncbi:MAG TPA: undecaprenyl-diphosphatase [Acidiphilium sp.]
MGWNKALFLAINAPAHPGAWALWFAWVCAVTPPVVVPLLLIGLWVRGGGAARGGLIAAAVATIVALGVNQILGRLWYEPRPFMIGLGHRFLAHAPDNSFPSDHATLVWSLACGLIMTSAARRDTIRRAGWALAVYGVAVAWARIFLGVHYPIDMLVPIPVALAAGWFARFIRPPVDRLVLPSCSRLYETGLVAFRLPPTLFPRDR